MTPLYLHVPRLLILSYYIHKIRVTLAGEEKWIGRGSLTYHPGED